MDLSDDVKFVKGVGPNRVKLLNKLNIYNLEELTDDILIYDDIPALKEQKYTIRLWVSNESSLPMGSDLHYHGIIEVVEEHE